MKYRGQTGTWLIEYDPKPIPDRSHDYNYAHEDYDGAPDSEDDRCGCSGSVEECIEEILELEEAELSNYYLCSSCQMSFFYSELKMYLNGLTCNNCWPDPEE
jgi:hypothetical protein